MGLGNLTGKLIIVIVITDALATLSEGVLARQPAELTSLTTLKFYEFLRKELCCLLPKQNYGIKCGAILH